MDLDQFSARVPALASMQHSERIPLFVWFLQRFGAKQAVAPSDVRSCYVGLHLAEPGNLHQALAALAARKPPVLLKSTDGYRLERRVLDELDRQYAERPITIDVQELLLRLPERVPEVAEREFLSEALVCLKAGAFRSAIVMTWNMAYDHLRRFVLATARDRFNTQWSISYSKEHERSRVKSIESVESFSELKESQVIQICKSAGIVSADVAKVLNQKLEVRNSAAHPSDVKFSQLTAESFIDDLVRNVVLNLQVP